MLQPCSVGGGVGHMVTYGKCQSCSEYDGISRLEKKKKEENFVAVTQQPQIVGNEGKKKL